MSTPADDEAFLRIVNVPRRGIGDASLALLGKYGARWAHPLLETARRAERIAELRPNVRDSFRSVADLIERLRQSAGAADPAMVLEQVLAVTGYEQYLAEEGPEGGERLGNVREVIAGAADWAEGPGATPRGERAGADGGPP